MYVCMYIRTYIHSPWRWRWDSAALETAACRGAARRRGAGRVRPLLSFRVFRNGASRAGWGNGRIPLVFHASLVSHGPLTRPADRRKVPWCTLGVHQAYVCVYVHAYIRTYVCMYVCMYLCMYVCTYVRTYIARGAGVGIQPPWKPPLAAAPRAAGGLDGSARSYLSGSFATAPREPAGGTDGSPLSFTPPLSLTAP